MPFPFLFCFYSLHFLVAERATVHIATPVTRFCIFLIWACQGFITMLFHSLKLQCQFFCFANKFEGFYSWPHRHWLVWLQETLIGNFSSGSGVAVTTSQVHHYLMLACFEEAVGSLTHMCENIWLSFGSFGNEKSRAECTVQTSWNHSSHFWGALADASFLCFWGDWMII